MSADLLNSRPATNFVATVSLEALIPDRDRPHAVKQLRYELGRDLGWRHLDEECGPELKRRTVSKGPDARWRSRAPGRWLRRHSGHEHPDRLCRVAGGGSRRTDGPG